MMDRLPGGLADTKEPGDFEPGQLGKGTKVELEHVDDKVVSQEIAMDHLTEDPKYYDKLETMEAKSAAMPSFESAVQANVSNQLRQQAVGDLGKILLTGLGVGAGAAGIYGIINALSRRAGKQTRPHRPVIMDIPMGAGKSAEQKEDGETGIGDGKPPRVQPAMGAPGINPAPAMAPVTSVGYKVGGFADFLSGGQAKTTAGIPWMMPAAVGTGAAGLYGGWKMVDHMLQRQRKAKIQNELDGAKQEFEAAMMAQYDTAKKTASANKTAKYLDKIYDTWEKQSISVPGATPERMGQMTGAYLTLAGIGAGLPAVMMYNWAKKRQRRALIEKAKKRKLRRQYAMRPPEIFARPVPIAVPKAPLTPQDPLKTAPSQDDLEGSPLDKV